MSYPFDCITEFIFVETEMAPSEVILIPSASQSQLMEKAAYIDRDQHHTYYHLGELTQV